jgi:hypothetical protein
VADTSTLQPLSRQERLSLSPDSDRDLLAQAHERFALAEEAESDERAQQLDALKFRRGDHWPAALRQDNMGEASEQLTMVIDRLNPMIQQTINAYRKSPLAMRVRPKGGGASKQVADMIEGHLRDIEQQSEAEIAYTIALDQAVGQGLGYFRLGREYEDERSFQQVLRIRPIYNRYAVYADPASVHPAALDLEWAFLIDRWPTSRFMQWYEVSPQELTLFTGAQDGTWRTDAQVQLAEYYYKTYETQTLVQLPNGTVLPHAKNMDPTWPTRETRIPTVHWCKMAGNAVLERTVWPGKHIPLIRVEGQRLNVNGEDKRTGMVQAGRDAQVSVDVYSTMEATAIMAAPKSPWLLYAEQISGYERFWNQANDPTLPYLLHKAVVVNGQLLPPPQRTVVEPAIQAITQAKVLAQQDLMATTGMFEASMGQPSNEQSGVAIDKRKIEAEGTNYTYSANLAWSIRALGTMCVEILPKLYTGPADLRQVSPDGAVKSTRVNEPYQDEQGQTQAHFLSQGQYEVVISSGPSYETSRMQVSEKLSGVLGAVEPEIQKYFLDTWAGSLDFPGSEDLAARFKTLVPPEALAASEQTDPKTQLVTLQNQVKQATEALQMLQQQLEQSKQTETVATQQVALLERSLADMKVRLDNKQAELQLDSQKAEIDANLAHEANQLKWHELELKYGFGQPNGALMPQNGTGGADG